MKGMVWNREIVNALGILTPDGTIQNKGKSYWLLDGRGRAENVIVVERRVI